MVFGLHFPEQVRGGDGLGGERHQGTHGVGKLLAFVGGYRDAQRAGCLCLCHAETMPPQPQIKGCHQQNLIGKSINMRLFIANIFPAINL